MSPPGLRRAGVVVARRAPRTEWGVPVWLPVAVLPAPSSAAPWTALGREGADALFYAGEAEIGLEPGVTAHYRDNLTAERPSLWVLLTGAGDRPEVAAVTADPYEGEAWADIGGTVEAVPMPPEIAAWLAAFTEVHYRDPGFVKRKRDRADPEALGRRRPGAARRPEDVE